MYPTNEKLKTFFDRNTIDTNKQGINQYFGDSENMLVDMSKISSPDMSDTQHEQRVANSLKLSETYGITYGDAYKSFPQWAKHYCGSEKDEDVYRAISLSYFPEEKSPLPEANTLFNLFSPSDEAPKESQVDATAFEAVGQFAFDFMESSVGGAYRLLGQPEMANEAVKRIEAYRPELSSQTQQTLTSDEWAADPRFWLYQGTSLGMQILPIVKTAQIASSIPYAFQLGAKAAKGMAYANSVTATAYYIANQNGTQAVSEAQQKGIEEEKLNNVYTETFVPSLYINLAANALGFMTGQFGEGAKGIKKLAGKGLGGFLAGAVGTEGELREQEAQEKAIANNLDVMIKTLPWWRPRTYEALMGDDPEKFKLATIAFIGESVGDSVVGHIISTSRSQGDRVLQRMYDTAKQQYGSKYINSFETPMEFVTDFQKRSEADSLKAATTIKAHLESKEQLNTIFTQASRELYEFEVMEKEGKTLTTEQSRAKEVNKAIDFYRKNPKKLLQDAGMDTPTSYLDFVKKHSALLKEHVSKISMTKMRSVGSAIGEGLEVVSKRIQLSAKKFVDAKGDYNKFKESMRKSLGVAIDPHLSELYSNAEKLVNSEAFKQEIKAKALYEVMKKRFPDSYKPELKKISDAYTKRTSTNNLIALQQEMQGADTTNEAGVISEQAQPEYNKMVVDELSSLAKTNLSAKESKSYIENIIEPMATKNITPKMIGEQLNYFNTTQFEKTKTTAKKATPFSVGRKQGVVSQQSKIKNLQAEVASFIRRNTDLNKNLDALRKKANFTKNKEQTIGDLTKQAREAFKGIKLPASILTKIKDVSIATEKTFDNKLGAAINAIESASRDKRNSLAYKSIISSLKKIKKAKSTPQVIKNLDVPSQKALMDTDFTNEIMDAIDEGIKISVDEADIPKWVTTAIDNLYGYSGKKNTVGAMSDSKLRVFVEVMDFYRQVRNNPQKELKAKFEKLVNNAASKIHKEQHSFFSKRNKLQEHIFELPDGKIINTWYQDYWKNYNNWMLTPEVLMWKLDGNKYGTLSKVFSENMQHSESLKDSVQRAFYELDEAVFGRKREKINDLKWGQSEHEFTDANGKKFMLSKYEVISMYLTAEQELGLNHLLKGGVRQQSKKGGISHHKINDATLQTMYKIMNSNTDLMTVASHTRDSYNMLSAYLNERSRGLVGYDIATVPDYFPLFVSKGDTNAYNEIYKPTTSINDIKEFMATTAATMNPYKQRDQKSNSPIMIGNARNILMGSLKKDSQYYGFAEAYRLGDAVLRNKTHGLEKALTNTYGSQSWKALNQLMTDLKTNKYQQTMDSWVGSCINTLTKGALSFNVPVMFMQPVSYNIARGEIETKYWSKGLVNLPKYIKSNLATKFDFMGKYSSNLFMRYRGQIGWSAGEALGKIADVKTKVGKVAQTGMKGIQHNDNATISAIWDAVTAEVEATQPTLTGDNKWDAVARRTEQVVHRTQPTFYRTDRPALARSGSFLAILTMRFSSQLIKNYALEVQSFTNLVQKQNTDMAMRTLTSLGISMVQIMLIKALVSAARREATEEIFNSRENKDFAENLISQMKSQSLGVATAATGQLGSLLLGIIAQTGYKKSGISEPISSAGAQLVRGILGIGELGLDFITEKRDNRGRLLWKKNLPREIYQLGRASSLASGVGGGDFWTLGSYMLSQNINKR